MRFVTACAFFMLLMIGTTAQAVVMPGLTSSDEVIKIKGQFVVRFADESVLQPMTSNFGMHRFGLPSVEKIFDDAKVESVRKLVPTETAVSSILERIYLVRLPDGADDDAFIARMKADPNVISVENDVACRIKISPNDPNYGQQWHLYQATRRDVHAPEAWDVETGSDTVILAIIDTGVNYRHPDLRNNIWINPSEDLDGDYVVFDSTDFDGQDNDYNGYVDDVVGYDFFDGGPEPPWTGEDAIPKDNDPNDFNGHGTHCAGIAAMVTNNGYGASGMAGGWGPAWRDRGVQIMCLRAGYSGIHPEGYEQGYVVMSAVVEAINYAVDNGADVISYSAGSSVVAGMPAAMLAARSAGITFCNSAGNENLEFPEDQYFADLGWPINVAWTTQLDKKNFYSNYGTWIDIAAPGSNIYSTYSYHYNPMYASLSGTSMAAPLVAGVAALIRSHYPDYDRAIVDTMIFNHADSIDDQYYHDGLLGAGRVNADSCLHFAPVARFSGSPQVGPAPLTVDFLDESPAAISWVWTFGDGGSSGDQNPQNTYNDPGLYTVSLEVEDPNGIHTDVRKFFILATADSLGGDSTKIGTGQSFPVEVSIKNTVPLDTIDMVFTYPEDSGVMMSFDSATAEGTRGENFYSLVKKDEGTGIVALQCIAWVTEATGKDPLFPGTGPFIKFWFTAQNSGTAVIDTGSTEFWSTLLRNRYHNFTPDFVPIKVTVGLRGDANGDGGINVGDAVYLNNHIFHEGPEPILYEGDANADGGINVGDVVYLVNFIFNEGPPPPP